MRYGLNTAEIRKSIRNGKKSAAIQRAHDVRPVRDSKVVAAESLAALNAPVATT